MASRVYIERKRARDRRAFLASVGVIFGTPVAAALAVSIGFALGKGLDTAGRVATLERAEIAVCEVIAIDWSGREFVAGSGSGHTMADASRAAWQGAEIPADWREITSRCK